MVILDERDFLNKELHLQGFSIFDFFDDHQVIDLETFCELPLARRSTILLVDTQTLLNHPELEPSFFSVMNTFLGVLFFHSQQNQSAESWVQDKAAFLKRIIGEYTLPMPQLQWTMLSNQLQFFWDLKEEQRSLQRHLVQFSQELDQTISTAQDEMLRARKLHERLVPKRSEEIKGVAFFYKYMAGEGGGGEFYDLIQTPLRLHQVLISSESYLVSSALIGLLNQHKQNNFSTANFLSEAQAEVEAINSSKNKKAEVQIWILEMDLVNLTLTCSRSGSLNARTEGFSFKQGKLELGAEPYQLTRGERIILFSPGFVFNWKEGRIKVDLYSFVQDHQQQSKSELMTELFLQLKLVQDSNFLARDATVVMMEVKRNGIHQI